MKRIILMTLFLSLGGLSVYAATLSVTIPDAQATRVVNGMAGQYGYEDFLVNAETGQADIPNPESKQAFVKRMVKEFIKNSVVAYEASQAGETAREAAKATAKSEVDIQD